MTNWCSHPGQRDNLGSSLDGAGWYEISLHYSEQHAKYGEGLGRGGRGVGEGWRGQWGEKGGFVVLSTIKVYYKQKNS